MNYRLFVSSLCCLLAFIGVSTAATSSLLIDNYRRALLLDPDNLSLHYHLGNALLLAGENQLAIESLSLAYPAYTDSLDLHFNLGIAYLRSKDLDSALLYSERAEELGALDNPDLYPVTDLYYNLALAYGEDDNLSEAERLFERLLLLDPDRGETHLLLGNLLARQGREHEALAVFERYRRLYPDDPLIKECLFSVQVNLAMQFLEEDEYQKTRDALEQARLLDPLSPLPRYYLGYLDYRAGSFVTAAEHLLAAKDGSPTADYTENLDAMLHNCAIALFREDHREAALEIIAPLLNTSKSAVKHYYLAASIHLQAQDFVKARRAFQQLLALDATHSEAAAALAFTNSRATEQLLREGLELLDATNPLAATSRLEEALSINANSSRARAALQQARSQLNAMVDQHFSAAHLAQTEGALHEALREVRSGLQLAPDEPRGHALQEQILASLEQELEDTFAQGKLALLKGRLADARPLLQQLLTMAPDHQAGHQAMEALRQRSEDLALQAAARGWQALDLGQLLAAEQAFTEALAISPELREARAGLEQSTERLDAATAREVQLGRQALSAGQFEGARKHYLNALALRDTPALRAGLATVEEAFADKLGSLLSAAQQAAAAHDFQRARTIYNQLLSLAKDHTGAHSGLIALERQQTVEISRLVSEANRALHGGVLRVALDQYRQVLELDPSHSEALSGLQAGRQQLREELARLIASSAGSLKQGDIKKAEATTLSALTLDPYNREAQDLLRRIKDLKSTTTGTGSAEQFYLQGIDLYTQGKYEDAIKAWQQVVLLSPGHEKAQLNINKAQRKLRSIGGFRNG